MLGAMFQSQGELVGIELLRAPAKLHALELADQMAQPIVLSGKLIALVNQACVLGTLGIALGPRGKHHGARSAATLSARVAGVTTELSHWVSALRFRNHKMSQRDAGLTQPAWAGDPRRVYPPPVQPFE